MNYFSQTESTVVSLIIIVSVTLFYTLLIAGPLVFYLSKKTYSFKREKRYPSFLTSDFFEYVQKKVDFDITHKKIREVISIEHTQYKNLTFRGAQKIYTKDRGFFAFTTTPNYIFLLAGRRSRTMKSIAQKIKGLNEKQVKEIIFAEEKYLRRRLFK